MKIVVSDTVRKTEYFKALERWNEGRRTGDIVDNMINIEIFGITDDQIKFYFDLQENLTEFINYDFDFENYDVYTTFELINDFFYPSENIFPFEVAVFLIKHGYKERFLSDAYYLALLYETPEVYNRIMEDEYYRDNHDLTQKLINLHEDVLTIDPKSYFKYKNYVITQHDLYFDEELKVVRRNKVNTYKLNTYKEIVETLKSDDLLFKTVLDILKIEGVVICGGFVNTLIHMYKSSNFMLDEGYNQSNRHRSVLKLFKDVDIFFYGIDDMDVILNNVKKIIEIIFSHIHNTSNGIKIYNSNNSISINAYINYQVIKRIYKNISQILLGFDLDSSACAIYSKDSKLYISYLPRYKFSVEHRFNIINPYRQSYTYNKRLMKYSTRGYSMFIPGAIHKINKFYNIKNIFPWHTLQDLLFSVLRIDYQHLFRNKMNFKLKLKSVNADSDYFNNSIKNIFNVSKIENENTYFFYNLSFNIRCRFFLSFFFSRSINDLSQTRSTHFTISTKEYI